MKIYNSGIYVIEVENYDKFYIGSSIDFKRRKRDHLYKLRKNNHYNTHMQNAFNKYGESAFKFKLFIYTDPNKEYLLKLEQRVIDSYDWDSLINNAKFTGSPMGHYTVNRMFDNNDIIQIFNLASNGTSLKELCELYNCDKSNMYCIISRKSYKDIFICDKIVLSAQNSVSSNKNIKFSDYEIQIVKDNYLTIGKDKIAKQLGRNPNSISNLARKLNLTDNSTFWTKEIDDFIAENYQKIGRSKCADTLGINVKLLSSRVHFLYTKGIDIRIGNHKNNTKKVWTQDKLKFIKDNIDKGSEFLASYFNVSTSIIRDTCYRNKIKLGTRVWNQDDVDFLMKNYIELGSRYCAKKLNKTTESVIQKYNYEKRNISNDA